MAFHSTNGYWQLLALLTFVVAAAAESSEPLMETCLGEECEIPLDSSSPGLSLLQTNAIKHAKGPTSTTTTTTTTKTTVTTSMMYTGPAIHQVAFVNMMRHGEKCEKDGIYLDKLGYARGKYLARCFTQKTPSEAMPFGTNITSPNLTSPNVPQSQWPGAQTRVLVGGGILTDSIRPLITALPLLEKLNITLDMPCENHTDPGCMSNNIFPLMTAGGTVIVMDTYQMLPYELALLINGGMSEFQASGGYDFDEYNHWPGKCDPPSAPHFKEPHCTVTDAVPDLGFNNSFPYQPESSCFDEIWQIKFTRTCTVKGLDGMDVCDLFNTASGLGAPYYGWSPESLRRLSEGFNGDADAPCAGDLAPLARPELMNFPKGGFTS